MRNIFLLIFSFFIFIGLLEATNKDLKIFFPYNTPIFDKKLIIDFESPYKDSLIAIRVILVNKKNNYSFMLKKKINRIKIDVSQIKEGSYYLYVYFMFRIMKRNIQRKIRDYVIITHKNYSKLSKKEFIKGLFELTVGSGDIMSFFSKKEIKNFYTKLFSIGNKKKIKHPLFYYIKTIFYLQSKNLKKSLASLKIARKQERYFKTDKMLQSFKNLKMAGSGKNYIDGYIYLVIESYYGLLIHKQSIENLFTPQILEDMLDISTYSTGLEKEVNSLNIVKIKGKAYLYIYCGIMKIKNNKLEESQELLLKALSIIKNINKYFPMHDVINENLLINFWIAYISYLKNDLSKMRKYIHKIDKSLPDYPALNFIRGKLLFDQGNYNKSVQYLKKCLTDKGREIFVSKHPELSFEGEIYNLIGMCYFNKGYYEIALDKFLSAVTAPDAIPAYKENLAICYQKLGEKQKAEKILKELSNVPDLFLRAYLDSLKQKIEYKPVSGVPVVWVMPFENKGGITKRAGIGEYLQDIMMSQLYKTKKFRIVERDRIQEIIKEKKLSISKFGDKKYLKEKSKIITADYIITGNFAEFREKYTLTVRMISVKSGEVVKIKEFTGKRFKDIRKFMKKFIL